MKYLLFFALVALVSVAFAQEDFWLTTSGTASKSSYIYVTEKQSVLFDAQLQIQDARDIVSALQNYVVNPFRTLTHIFVLSDSPASYLGLETIVQAFPNVTVFAAPNVANSIIQKFKTDIPAVVAMGYKNINNQIPKINSLLGNSFTVGNTKFEVFEYQGISSAWSSAVWVPSQRALITGELVSNGIFPSLGFAAGANSYDKWRVTLTELSSSFSPIQTLYPGYGAVVPAAQTAAAIDTQRRYLDDFRTAIQAPNTLAQALDYLKTKYPAWTGLEFAQYSLAIALPNSICSLNCVGKTCGDDGCGGCCGVCEDGFSCNPHGQCECVPKCAPNQCGDDGCGGKCGACKYGSCGDDGFCACIPSCTEGRCGGDGCGGSCGCYDGLTCNSEGFCAEPEPNVVDLRFQFGGLVSFDCNTNPSCNQL
eukprot:TRINITY_DN1173_c0_g1_i1.p1 TRINITY_DN1173_c0_g1~~TRINITY_DN1173_c0_g1_i1.p1  ORF type:complete len:422 (-),score=107.50 TRINITY_DN1173_c0_g1_i1:162-1427(-)